MKLLSMIKLMPFILIMGMGGGYKGSTHPDSGTLSLSFGTPRAHTASPSGMAIKEKEKKENS